MALIILLSKGVMQVLADQGISFLSDAANGKATKVLSSVKQSLLTVLNLTTCHSLGFRQEGTCQGVGSMAVVEAGVSHFVECLFVLRSGCSGRRNFHPSLSVM